MLTIKAVIDVNRHVEAIFVLQGNVMMALLIYDFPNWN